MKKKNFQNLLNVYNSSTFYLHAHYFVSMLSPSRVSPNSISSNKLAHKYCTVESFLSIPIWFLYPAVHLQGMKRERSRTASHLFKLITYCNENKHGPSVLIFFSGAITSSVILFTLSPPPRPPHCKSCLQPSFVHYFGTQIVIFVLDNWCALAIPTPLSTQALEKT